MFQTHVEIKLLKVNKRKLKFCLPIKLAEGKS